MLNIIVQHLCRLHDPMSIVYNPSVSPKFSVLYTHFSLAQPECIVPIIFIGSNASLTGMISFSTSPRPRYDFTHLHQQSFGQLIAFINACHLFQVFARKKGFLKELNFD